MKLWDISGDGGFWKVQLDFTFRARAGTLSKRVGEATVGVASVGALPQGFQVKLEVLTGSTANLGMHNRIGSGRVRHLDVKWLFTQEAVHAGRVSLKKVGTYSNVSDLTTKHHDEERLKVFMTLGRLRYTRGHGDAVSTAN